MSPNRLALGAIALWSTLAALGVALAHVPPFLLTGCALVIGSAASWPRWRSWRVPPRTLAVGVYGLFGFHFLLFVALRNAPAVQANLVNYLWPLLIVVLAPVLLPATPLRAGHVVAAIVGFAGAALAILTGAGDAAQAATAAAPASSAALGYAAALGSAFIWATYSLLTRRLPAFPTSAVGLFGLVSGLLSLACHFALEPRATIAAPDLALIALAGIGPMGAAFFLWDRAMKDGDPRTIGLLSYLTPVASTALLLTVTGSGLRATLALAAVMVVGSAMLGAHASRAFQAKLSVDPDSSTPGRSAP
ncbi:MAG TPA: EamA family transporter [Burkholderiaceae bacterium]